IEIRPGEAFDQVKLLGVRKAAITHPKFFIEAFRVDNEGIAFPLADGASVVQGVVRIATKLTLLSAPIGVDDPVIAVSTADKYENPLSIAVFIELNTIGQLILPRTSGRHTVEKHWIVFQEVALAQFVQVASPLLKWRHFVDVADIFQQTICIGGHDGSGLHQTCSRRRSPVTGLSRWGS